jgi:hypothetical protein
VRCCLWRHDLHKHSQAKVRMPNDCQPDLSRGFRMVCAAVFGAMICMQSGKQKVSVAVHAADQAARATCTSDLALPLPRTAVSPNHPLRKHMATPLQTTQTHMLRLLRRFFIWRRRTWLPTSARSRSLQGTLLTPCRCPAAQSIVSTTHTHPHALVC